MESRAIRKQAHYISYLLRLWQTSSDGKWMWRSSLEDPLTGKQHGFGDVEELFAFIRHQIEIEKLNAEGR